MEEIKSFLDLNIKSKCSGCSACEQSCLKKCIKMVKDEEGFSYPKIDPNKCINCGRCRKVCPISNSMVCDDLCSTKRVFAYRTIDFNDLLKASSGGAFADLCFAFCNNSEKYAIFGAIIDDDFKIKHSFVTSLEQIDIFKKSKYVQSDVGNSYLEVRDFLNKGYKVVFSGTPCQIAGLKAYLHIEHENLLLIDIICHGVPSQKVFDKYIEFEKLKHNDELQEIGFREKNKYGNKWNSKSIKLLFNKSNIPIVEDFNKNLFLRGYQSRLFFRPSCYDCKFDSKNRFSDITIGDCWGIENVLPNEDMHKGISMVVCNTNKGSNVCELLRGEVLAELDEDFAIKNNECYDKGTPLNKNRDKFYREIDIKSFDKLINKYTPKMMFLRKVWGKMKRIFKR